MYRWLRAVFPASQLILLVRDPFDVLDSYPDLQKPGSWNRQFATTDDPLVESNVRRTCEHMDSTMRSALEAYDTYPDYQKLQVSYEQLLQNPTAQLQRCAALVGVDVSEDEAAQVARRHAFTNDARTGPLRFRRHGKAGIWRKSENFTNTVTRVAYGELGPTAKRLGFGRTHTDEKPDSTGPPRRPALICPARAESPNQSD